MRTALVLARKEVLEILRTWRLYVLPSIMLLFAATGPLLAKYTPQLLGAVAGGQLGSLHLPEPTVFDSYGQWIKNLSQLVLFALIIMYGGIVSTERRSGTAVLVLTKPASRGAFVLVKAVVHALYVMVLLIACTFVTWGLSAVLFPTAPGGPLWSAALVWLVLAVAYLSLMTLFSVLIPSAAGASGAGLGAFVVLSVGGLWKPLSDYSPAGLLGRAASIAGGDSAGFPFLPVATALVMSVAAVGLAATIFRRKEL
ncbi:ABC transporter permease [Arthrobacter wenxiniae]|jgi:ABC-2 type transport system permease protein|uniref:ABC transporter permease subunit n=1 Tax=Arthrobacter wenxiniae TaxID=2713570 RepID=A0A7Y7LXD5_9MICC|nr:ABC transporter permease subunit [Arthrobacter wenxiniae]NVM94240.1 ABC transporter permease subunit [Arthrobacter wenxiniae]